MGMAAKDELGKRGEDVAVEHLARCGLTVVERNWRCPQGEVDVVATDGTELVFVEVKTRSGVRFGYPLEAITALKLARLRRLAHAWCAAHPGNGGRRIRIDAIGIVLTDRGLIEIDHLEGVF